MISHPLLFIPYCQVFSVKECIYVDLQIFFQIINVYITKYESGGRMWPIVHNTTIFSVVMMQIIALGVFGLKRSPIASGFTIPLLIGTLLFNEYCRQRFSPAFQKVAAEVLICNFNPFLFVWVFPV